MASARTQGRMLLRLSWAAVLLPGAVKAATVRAVDCPIAGWCCEATADDSGSDTANRLVGFAAGRCNETGYDVAEGEAVPVLVGDSDEDTETPAVPMSLSLFRFPLPSGGPSDWVLPAADGVGRLHCLASCSQIPSSIIVALLCCAASGPSLETALEASASDLFGSSAPTIAQVTDVTTSAVSVVHLVSSQTPPGDNDCAVVHALLTSSAWAFNVTSLQIGEETAQGWWGYVPDVSSDVMMACGLAMGLMILALVVYVAHVLHRRQMEGKHEGGELEGEPEKFQDPVGNHGRTSLNSVPGGGRTSLNSAPGGGQYDAFYEPAPDFLRGPAAEPEPVKPRGRLWDFDIWPTTVGSAQEGVRAPKTRVGARVSLGPAQTYDRHKTLTNEAPGDEHAGRRGHVDETSFWGWAPFAECGATICGADFDFRDHMANDMQPPAPERPQAHTRGLHAPDVRPGAHLQGRPPADFTHLQGRPPADFTHLQGRPPAELSLGNRPTLQRRETWVLPVAVNRTSIVSLDNMGGQGGRLPVDA